jgi:hypothetical protein
MTNSVTKKSLQKLQNQINAMEAATRHLHNINGAHMRALSGILLRTGGGKPVQFKTPNPTAGDGFIEQLSTSSLGALSRSGIRMIGEQINTGLNLSQGQMMGQLASAIARTMSRNL